MKWLWDDCDSSSEGEYLLCSHDRVKCSESRIIQCDIFIWDSSLDEGESHCLRFIVIRVSIVSWDENMSYFPAFIEFLRCLNSSSEKEIGAIDSRSGPKQESDFTTWNTLNLPIDTILCRQGDYSPWKHEENSESKKDLEKFTHFYILYTPQTLKDGRAVFHKHVSFVSLQVLPIQNQLIPKLRMKIHTLFSKLQQIYFIQK